MENTTRNKVSNNSYLQSVAHARSKFILLYIVHAAADCEQCVT